MGLSIDREKVIKGLQIERECVSRDCDRDCGKCDLVQERDWLLSAYDDAIALLKEQEAVKIEVKKINSSGRCGRCQNCLIELNEMDYPNYCGYCGQKVRWE